MSATVAILGRPNVGKSTLFNRLVGRKIALVDDQPGVTRDRREGEGRIGDLRFTVIDTAGLDTARRDSLEARMSAQAETAIDAADLVLFVIDARAGVTPVDRQFAERIRRRGKPVVVVANKAEGRAAEPGVMEAFELGFGVPLAVSAEHGEGLDQLYDAIRPFADGAKARGDAEDERATGPLRLAIVGQPNAGKSTLVNALLGEDRMLTGPEAGITRDAIFSDFDWQGQRIRLWDTAGIRRKAKVSGKIEKLAVSDALRAIRFADCIVVLVDATLPIESQDLTLCNLVAEEGRAVVVALSKWDLVEEKQKTLKDVASVMEDVLPEIRGVPVVTISAKQERGLDRLMAAVLAQVARWSSRIATAQLNRWLEAAMERNPPPAPAGRRIKIRYATQAGTRPPAIALFGNQLARLPQSYLRYLMNGLRDDFDLWGVPIRFSLRGGKNPFAETR
jgi:GTP-binding protein